MYKKGLNNVHISYDIENSLTVIPNDFDRFIKNTGITAKIR